MKEDALNPKELVSAYLALSTQLDRQYASRRSLEWKIHISLWTLLAAAGYAVLNYAPTVNHWGLIGALLVVTLLHFVWTVKMHTGQFRDQKRSQVYRDKADHLLHKFSDNQRQQSQHVDGTRMPEWLQKCFESYWWWVVAEVGTTVLIATLVYYLDVAMVQRQSTVDVSGLEKRIELLRSELDHANLRLDSFDARGAQLQLQVQQLAAAAAQAGTAKRK